MHELPVSTEHVAPTIGHMLVLKHPPTGVVAPESHVPPKSGQKTVTLLHDAAEPEHAPPVGRHSLSPWHTLPIGPVQ